MSSLSSALLLPGVRRAAELGLTRGRAPRAQNRRQRDSRALKAAQLSPASADGKGQTSTTNAEAILEQLRMMNQARRSINPNPPSPTGANSMVPPGYMPGQPMFMHAPMMPPAQMMPMQQMPGMQMYGARVPGVGGQELASQMSQMQPHAQMAAVAQQQMLAQQQMAPQQMLASQALSAPQMLAQQQMMQQLQMQQMAAPNGLQQLGPSMTQMQMPQTQQQMAQQMHMSAAMQRSQQNSLQQMCAQAGTLYTQPQIPPTYQQPRMMVENVSAATEGMAAATMMGLCNQSTSGLDCERLDVAEQHNGAHAEVL